MRPRCLRFAHEPSENRFVSDTLLISSRYRVKRAYVVELLKQRGVKASARARAAALGISPSVAWRLLHEPEPGEAEFYAGPAAAAAIFRSFPNENPTDLVEAA